MTTAAQRFWTTVLHDVRIQARSQLYTIGIAVAVVTGIAVRFLLPEAGKAAGLACFYVLALGGTTYMFSAVMFLGDRSQNTLDALQVSPMTAWLYAGSKAVTLSSFAFVEAVIVYAVGGGWPVPVLPLALGIFALGLVYTFLGLAQVAPHTSVTGFLMPGAVGVSLFLQLPVLYVVHLGPPALYYAVPTMPALLLMRTADLALAPIQLAYVGFGVPLTIGLSAWAAVARLRHHAGLR